MNFLQAHFAYLKVTEQCDVTPDCAAKQLGVGRPIRGARGSTSSNQRPLGWLGLILTFIPTTSPGC